MEVLKRNDGISEADGAITTKANQHVEMEKAIAAGILKPTVKGIRSFIGCSQSKAMELRRIYNIKVKVTNPKII
jgi:hypothetical protein